MKEHIHMTQFSGREDWLKARSSRIGGSEAASILGMNPYMTNTDLWDYKTGRKVQEDISDKPVVKYGHDAEPYLRELFRLDHPQYEVHYIPDNMFVNDKYPWAHASLDGWMYDEDGCLGILEIKTTNILRSMQKEKWNDRIPANYYCQVLWYMMVMEADFAILKAQLKYEYTEDVFLQTRHYFINRSDVEEDIEFLRQSAEKFWSYVQQDKRPPTILPEI